jgi:omega-amidase
MQVVCCQYDIAWEDKAANYARVQSLLGRAGLSSGSLVVLPEMSFTGFSMNVAAVAERSDASSERFLSETARQLGINLIGGVVQVGPDGRGRNQLLAYSPEGRELGRYSKMQPFTLGEEAQHYTAGDAITTFQCGDCLIAPFICYDLRFPEIFRVAAQRRPQLFVVIANWPDARLGHWVKLLQARAIENQAYVVGVNRCGNDPRYKHSGRSLVCNFHGDVIADAGNSEGTVTAKLDLASLEQYRRELPFLADIRQEYVGAR